MITWQIDSSYIQEPQKALVAEFLAACQKSDTCHAVASNQAQLYCYFNLFTKDSFDDQLTGLPAGSAIKAIVSALSQYSLT